MSEPVSKRVYLTYPTELVGEPLVCRMYDSLGVYFNLRTASITQEIGIIGLELLGPAEDVRRAIEFFRERGVQVDLIEPDEAES